MQIHELTGQSTDATPADAQSLLEAGLLDYLKTLKTPQGMAGMSWEQRASAVARDAQVQNLAKVALKAWQGRTFQLAKVAGEIDPQTKQPKVSPTGAPVIDAGEYQRQLVDFIDNQLLQGSYRYLEPNSKNRVDAVIKEITAAKDNPQALQTAFMKLTPVTTTALQDSGQAMSTTGTTTKPTPATTQQKLDPTSQAIFSVWNKMDANVKNNLAQKFRSVGPIKSTGNTAVDLFLTKGLGMKVNP